MDEKILLRNQWYRSLVYFLLGYIGVAITDLLNWLFTPFLIIPHTPINIVYPILGGVVLSIYFSWQDKINHDSPSPDGVET